MTTTLLLGIMVALAPTIVGSNAIARALSVGVASVSASVVRWESERECGCEVGCAVD